METLKTKDQCQWSTGQMVRAYAMVTSLSNGRGNMGEGKGGCIRMAKEKSVLGLTSKDSTSSQQHHAETKTLTQPLRDTSQSHSKGAHLRKDDLKAVAGLLAPQCVDSRVTEMKAIGRKGN